MAARNPRPNPYVGPRAFRTGEALYGRDREIRQLLDLLVAERIVLLHSPSGAGKTSLIRAGLIPRLQEQGFTVLPVMRVNQELPPEAPPGTNRYLVSALLSLEEEEQAGKPLFTREELFSLSLDDYLTRRSARQREAQAESGFAYREGELADEVLILDQFEEILTSAPADVEGKRQFFTLLGEALRQRQRWALVAMREDYIAALAPYLRSIPTRLRTTFRLDLLEAAAALQAIQEPARSQDVQFTNEAAWRLVDDLRAIQEQQADGTLLDVPGPTVEPVQLQVVCYRLWQNLAPDDIEITEEDIQAVGDVNQSLAEYYAERVSAAAQETGVPERLVRAWFQDELLTEQGIRSQVIMGPESTGSLPNAAVNHLRDAHLLRAEKRRSVTWFELAHDRLVEPVRLNNQAWFQANLSLLQRQASLWEAENRPPGLLMSGQELVDAEAWAEAHPAELNQADQDFLKASQQKRLEEEQAEQAIRLEAAEKLAESEQRRAEEQARSASRLRRRLLLSLGLLLVAVVFAVLAGISLNIARQNAVAAQQVAATNELLASENATAAVEAIGNAATAFAASTQAVAAQSTSEANEKLANTASTQAIDARATAVLAAEEARVLAEQQAQEASRQSLLARSGELAAQSNGSILFLPQRSLLLAVEAARVVEPLEEAPPLNTLQNLYDALGSAGGVPYIGPSSEVWDVDASADGRWMAASGRAPVVYLWDLQTADSTAQPVEFSGHSGPVSRVRFIPGRPWLASAGRDGSVRIWDIESGAAEPLFSFTAHSEAVDTLDASPDGRWLASGGRDNKVVVWDLSGSEPEEIELPLGGDATSLKFSPDSTRLAAGSTDNNAYLWSLAQLDETPLLLPASDNVLAVAFNPAGDELGSGDENGRVYLFPLNDPDPAAAGQELGRHTGQVRTLAFSPDGAWLASGSTDNNAVLWNTGTRAPLQSIVLRGHEGGVLSLGFTEDGSALLTASTDSTLRRWDLTRADPGNEPLVLYGHEGSVRDLAMIPGQGRMVSGSNDHRLRLWDLRAPSLFANPRMLAGHTNDVRIVNFSPDGRWLVSAGRDFIPLLWDLEAGDLQAAPIPLEGHTDDLSSAVFSPTERWLATTGGDRTIRLWDLQADEPGSPVQTLRGHGSRVMALAFTPDGRLLSASRDGTVRVWDEDSTGEAAQVLEGHQAGVITLAASPDGCRAASGDEEGAVFLWDLCAAQPGGELLWQDGDTRPIQALAFSPAGDFLAAGVGNTNRGDVQLWSLDEGQPGEPVTLEGHIQQVNELAFSPDERWLASASDDSTTRLYALDDLENPFVLQSRGSGRVYSLSFTPDSTGLVTAGDDGNARLWDLTSPTPNTRALNLFAGRVLYDTAVDPSGRYLAAGGIDDQVRLWSISLEDLLAQACRTAGRNLTEAEWEAFFADEPYAKTCSQWP
jgi:WD40 repeat protein